MRRRTLHASDGPSTMRSVVVSLLIVLFLVLLAGSGPSPLQATPPTDARESLAAGSGIDSGGSGCVSIGEVAGDAVFNVSIGGNATFNWTIINYGCRANVTVQLSSVPPVPNTTTPKLSAKPLAFTVAASTSHVIVLKVHMPKDRRNVGVNWPSFIVGASEVAYGYNCTSQTCVQVGVAKRVHITAYNPALPDVLVTLLSPSNGSTLFTGGRLKLLNTTQNQTTASGFFIPRVSFTANRSVLWSIQSTYSNLHGSGNGTYNLSVDGKKVDFARLLNFTGTVPRSVPVRLGPGSHSIRATVYVRNSVGSSRSTVTAAFNVTSNFTSATLLYYFPDPGGILNVTAASALNATYTVHSGLVLLAAGSAVPSVYPPQQPQSVAVTPVPGIPVVPGDRTWVSEPINLVTAQGQLGNNFRVAITFYANIGPNPVNNWVQVLSGYYPNPP